MKNHRILQIVLSLAAVLALVFAAQLGVIAVEAGLPVAQEDVLSQQQPDGAVYTGTCGTNVSWSLNTSTGVLNITGSGKMYDYTSGAYAAPWYADRSSIKEVVIGSGVTSVGDYAFRDCSVMTKVAMASTVTSIGRNAFFACHKLETLSIPSRVSSIGERAFAYCKSLKFVAIPSGVTTLDTYTFVGCESLVFLTIPSSVKSIGLGALSGCTNLAFVSFLGSFTEWNGLNVAGDNDPFLAAKIALSGSCGEKVTWAASPTTGELYISGDGAMDNYTTSSVAPWGDDIGQIKTVEIGNGITKIGDYAFSNNYGVTSVVFPSSLKTIGNSAFFSCSELKSVTIPDGVTSIETNAFAYCRALESVTIPNSVTSMGTGVFNNCTALKSLTIPNKLTSIGSYVVSGCQSLEKVTIPKSVKIVDYNVFNGCTSLHDVYYEGTAAEWGKITIYSNNQPLLTATKHYKLDVVTGLRQSNHGSDFISLSWNSVEGATGYYIYRMIGGKWEKIATVSATTAKITKLAPGASYDFKVRACDSSSTGEYSAVVSAHTGPSAMTGKVSVNRQDSEMIRLQWDKINNADGYMIYWYVNGKLTKLSATLNTAYSITKLNSDTKYTFKVRGYRKVGNGIYVGGYSADFVTWTGPNPTTGTAVAKTKSATLSWDAVEGATKYYIYVYTEATGYYTCVCSTTATSKTITGLKSGQAYYYRVKACKVNDGVNYYSSYSNVMFARAK